MFDVSAGRANIFYKVLARKEIGAIKLEQCRAMQNALYTVGFERWYFNYFSTFYRESSVTWSVTVNLLTIAFRSVLRRFFFYVVLLDGRLRRLRNVSDAGTVCSSSVCLCVCFLFEICVFMYRKIDVLEMFISTSPFQDFVIFIKRMAWFRLQ